MAKHIDVEKLKVLLSELKKGYKQYRNDFYEGAVFAVNEMVDEIEENIDSLQQEQPELPDNLDKAAEDYCTKVNHRQTTIITDSFKAGAEWMAKQNTQPEVDLDEEVDRFFEDCIEVYEVPLYGKVKERVITVDCYEITARHFYRLGRLGLNAKEE